jgi:hypothetical protein
LLSTLVKKGPLGHTIDHQQVEQHAPLYHQVVNDHAGIHELPQQFY